MNEEDAIRLLRGDTYAEANHPADREDERVLCIYFRRLIAGLAYLGDPGSKKLYEEATK